RDYGVAAQSLTSSAGVLTIDYTKGQDVYVTLTENITSIVVNNWPANSTGLLTITFIQDATGGRTVAWPASWLWPFGLDPTVQAEAGADTEIALRRQSNGVIRAKEGGRS